MIAAGAARVRRNGFFALFTLKARVVSNHVFAEVHYYLLTDYLLIIIYELRLMKRI